MRVLSLFDGISIARQALKNLGIKVECYYASEIDKYALQIAQKNFPDTIQLGDIRNVKIKGNFDLLIGGSPCQDLSIAKKNRQGLSGERSGLFWEYVRILKEVKPKYFILENVASMPKEAVKVISEALGVEPIMINAALVSAQNRKRLFWTNIPNVTQPKDKNIFLRDILESGETEKLKSYCVDANYYKGTNLRHYQKKGKRQIVFMDNGKEKLKSNTIRTGGKGSGLGDKHNWDTIRVGEIGKGGQGDRIYSVDGKSVNLSANGGGRGAKTGLYLIKAPNGKDMEVDTTKDVCVFKEVRTEHGKKSRREFRKMTGKDSTKRGALDKKYIAQDNGKGNCITTGLGVEGLVGMKIKQTPEGHAFDYYNNKVVPNKKAKTLGTNPQSTTAVAGQLVNDNFLIRKLTPIECERLQSLPDGYTDGISNTQRYKCLGNGFNCAVIEHILSFI